MSNQGSGTVVLDSNEIRDLLQLSYEEIIAQLRSLPANAKREYLVAELLSRDRCMKHQTELLQHA